MKSIIVRGVLLFLIGIVPKQVISQTISPDNLQGDVEKFIKPLISKSTKAGSDYIKKIEFQPYVVTEDEQFSLTLEVE